MYFINKLHWLFDIYDFVYNEWNTVFHFYNLFLIFSISFYEKLPLITFFRQVITSRSESLPIYDIVPSAITTD